MANAHRGTFRYATLTGDRFFSPIRHSTPLMTTLYSARGAARRFFFFFLPLLRFVFFFRNGYTTIVHIATMVRRWTWIIILRRSFPTFPRLLRLSRESLQLSITTYDIKRISFAAGTGFTRVSCFSCSFIHFLLSLPRLRNHRGRNVTKYFQNFYVLHIWIIIRILI